MDLFQNENDPLLRAIFEASYDAVGVSIRGVHRLVNPAYARLFGFDTPADLVGRPILDLIAPEEHDHIRAKIARRAEGLEVPGVYLTRGRRRDGTMFDMEVSGSSYVLDGETHTLVMLRDVTAQRAAEVALRESHELYRALFEQNTAVKLLTDPATMRIVDVNDAGVAFYGYAREFLRGQPLTLLNPMDASDLRTAAAAVIAGNLRHFQVTHRLADGRLRQMEVDSGPVSVGGRTLMFSILHDVTDRAELEAQLRQAQKMEAIGQLAGGIAHDFNNLLTVVTGLAELLEGGSVPPDRARGYAREIRRQAERGQGLTRQLLAASRRQVVQPRVLDLAALLRDTEGLVRRIVGERIPVALEIAGDPLWVTSDPSQLEQVVLNLAVNARDAMPAGGALTLRASASEVPVPSAGNALPAGSWVAIEVADTGVGMDDATRARVFEPFFTTKDKAKNSGLGLATVHGIVTQSGGRVLVSSAPGAGSRFTVLLPRVAGPVAAVAAPEDAPVAPVAPLPAAPAHTVLLAEDDDGVRVFLRERLRAAGYDVIDARNGAEALDLARSAGRGIDVLVTDVSMPGLTGPQLYDALVRERPGVKVLFVSGDAHGLLSRQQLAATGGRFLAKPFTGQQIERALSEIVGG